MPIDDRQDEGRQFRKSPTGPWAAPSRAPTSRPQATTRVGAGKRRPPIWSVLIFILLISGIGIRAYRDLSRPEAWAYWKESYFSPSMTSSLIAKADFDGSARARPALAISGTIGVATASWLREGLDEAHLVAGDTVLLSSPGGDLNQAIIMGEIIRSRGLATAVGIADASGQIRRPYCASACVLVFCRRQAPLWHRGLGAGGPSICDIRARPRPRCRHPAHRGDGLELYDQDGRVLCRCGGDVGDQGCPLARPQGSLSNEPRHRSRRQALNPPLLI